MVAIPVIASYKGAVWRGMADRAVGLSDFMLAVGVTASHLEQAGTPTTPAIPTPRSHSVK